MRNSQQLLVLASAMGAAALNAHRHAHHAHIKRDVVFAHTAYTTVTVQATVTVYDDEIPAASPGVFAPQDHKENYLPVAVTPVVPVAPPPSQAAAPPPAEVTPQAIALPTSVDVAPVDVPAGGSDVGKRGLAYNQGNLVKVFNGGKPTWTYNWGQVADGGAGSDHEFVPMMWGPPHLDGWAGNAEKAIANGAKNFLSFNECDHPSQANMGPGAAASLHQQVMNPYSGRVRISTPAITNSQDPNQGIGWLRQFLGACGGQCAYDFCAIHWYDVPDSQKFLDHLEDAHKVCGKPIWVTEFAPINSDDATINTFLGKVMTAMDTDSRYIFVERYAFFMLADGMLTRGNQLSTYGKTYAFS